MKHFYFLLFFLHIMVLADCRNDTCHSHSVFIPRDITSNNLLQHNLTLFWWYRTIFKNHDTFITLQVSPFYQRSTNEDDIARFFLPCNQPSVSVKEDGTGDIGSLWLNLIADANQQFDGSFSLSPQRTLIGTFINIRINWNPILNIHLWSDIALAAMKSKHNIGLCEKSNTFGTACNVTNICQALNQENWEFNTFCPETQTKHGVDNIEFKFGYDWYFLEEDSVDHLSPYFTFAVPTGKAGTAECIFEPIVGSTVNAVGFGFIADHNFYADEIHELAILTDFKYLYGLPVHEKRSFDLCKNGDWSRYLQVVKCDEPSNSMPGINVFTQEAQITIQSRIDWWIALHYRHRSCDVEIGYNFWWQQKEKVQIYDFPKGYAIYDIVGDCMQQPTSASCAQICQSVINNAPVSDPSCVKLSLCDLNIASGTMPRSLTNSVYAAFGYDGHFYGLPTLIGAGASYEVSTDNNALSNWCVWSKFGISY
ncbi:MAG: hypothetical protein WD055_00910 [Candidatus Dependentiae bacterium]